MPTKSEYWEVMFRAAVMLAMRSIPKHRQEAASAVNMILVVDTKHPAFKASSLDAGRAVPEKALKSTSSNPHVVYILQHDWHNLWLSSEMIADPKTQETYLEKFISVTLRFDTVPVRLDIPLGAVVGFADGVAGESWACHKLNNTPVATKVKAKPKKPILKLV